MKLKLAVLATAALALVAFNINAQDSYSPDSSTAITRAVRVNSATGVQSSPSSYKLLQGYSGGSTNPLTTTGTNFVASPIAPFQLINAAADINFVSASDTSATTGWETVIAIKAGTTNRALATPTGWNWATNAALTAKITSIASNNFALLRIVTVGTNVFVSGAANYKP